MAGGKCRTKQQKEEKHLRRDQNLFSVNDDDDDDKTGLTHY